MKTFLIVGLGNPGSEYRETRHNIGFKVVRAFAEKQGFVFRRALNGIGELAQGVIEGNKVILLLPMTYMNTSGNAVRLFVDYFKLSLEDLLVIVDDIYLPFGTMRIKEKGSAGGHNGLKSIEAHLGSQDYPRLKMGVGDDFKGDLAEHVLTRFTPKEQELLNLFIQNGAEALTYWILQGKSEAIKYANTTSL